jgi:hypothetical protein
MRLNQAGEDSSAERQSKRGPQTMLDAALPNVHTCNMSKKISKQPTAISDQLRVAIRDADCTRYAIFKATGIPQETMTRFLQGKRGLSLPTVDVLCEFLDLELTKRKG